MYSRYCDYFTRLLNHDTALRAGWSFDNSIFPTTTVNFGPNAVCFDHLDFANAAAGWCAITSTGNYDPTRGGHLVLFDIDMIIEFPPGSTILIPSSVMRHGNTPIQAGETRAGITQYAAGALFRWVDNGFMKADSTSDEVKARMAAEAPQSLLDIECTVVEAEEFASKDELQRKHVEALNALSNFVYGLKGQLADQEGLDGKIDDDDKKTILTTLKDTAECINENGLEASIEELEEKPSEVQGIACPKL
ncbi:hypothetical protein HWV62_31539 [Athelia sp. TMB]|nr:hypothetical protein HWV62_31539 [Athelia sp. TMB]